MGLMMLDDFLVEAGLKPTKASLGRIQKEKLLPYLVSRQRFKCPVCGNKLSIPQATLHHAIFTRSNITAWKDQNKRAYVLLEPLNCLALHRACHFEIEGNRQWGWSLLASLYGFSVMHRWYQSMEQHFKAGLPMTIARLTDLERYPLLDWFGK